MSIRDQIIISIFIVFYWFIVLICVMADCPLKQAVHQYTRLPELLLGAEQSWRMFCPNPRTYSLHCYAIVTFKDGATAYYEFPRLERMSQWDAFLRERLRKHYDDIMPWFEFRMFRPFIARYIARGFFDASNPPIQVSLCFNRENIRSMPYPSPRFPSPRERVRENFYVYKVRPEDFR
jgi:hypothetical protein